jgi:hypothetical protein
MQVELICLHQKATLIGGKSQIPKKRRGSMDLSNPRLEV